MIHKNYPLMDNAEKYAFACARLALLEKTLLTQGQVNQLKMASSLQDLAKMLSDTGYAGLLESHEDISHIIDGEILKFKKELYEIVPADDYWVLDIFFRRYDYNNLKICLKTYLTGRDIPVSELSKTGCLPPEELTEFFQETRLEWIPFPIDFFAIKESYEKDGEIRIVDVIADKAYYDELLSAMKKLNDDFFLDYANKLIDLKNIIIFTRCKLNKLSVKDFLLEGGYMEKDAFLKLAEEPNIDVAFTSPDFRIYKDVFQRGLEVLEKTGAYTVLETDIRNYLMSMLTEVQDCIFSLKPFIGYLLAKEHEINLLKKIYIHIHNHIDFGKEPDLVYYV